MPEPTLADRQKAAIRGEQVVEPQPAAVQAPASQPDNAPQPAASAKVPEGTKQAPEQAPAAPASIPKFEDLLTEKSGGKFKSYEDVDKIYNEYEQLKATPKEEFAHEAVRKMNDFVKKGGVPDNQWWKLITTDYDAMSDPYELLAEKMRLEHKGITDDEINYELNKQYLRSTLDTLKDSDDADEKLTYKATTAKLNRESQVAKQFLKDYQTKAQVINTAPTPEQVKAQQDAYDKSVQSWDSSVEEAAKAFSKIPVAVKSDNGEVKFDFELDKEQQKAITDFTKELGRDAKAAFAKKYSDSNGKINIAKILENEAKVLALEGMLAKAVTNARSLGAKEVVSGIKNTNFKPQDRQANMPDGSLFEKQKAAMKESIQTA